jgi:hypothetical protein
MTRRPEKVQLFGRIDNETDIVSPIKKILAYTQTIGIILVMEEQCEL